MTLSRLETSRPPKTLKRCVARLPKPKVIAPFFVAPTPWSLAP